MLHWCAQRVRRWTAATVVMTMAASLLVLAGLPVTAANASVGGCSPSTWVGGFRLGSCIDDQNSGVVAHPDAYVDYVPTASTCVIEIQLWDDQNHRYSNQPVGCTTGHYVGQSATVSSAVSLHAFARVSLDNTWFPAGDSAKVKLGQGITTGQGQCTDHSVQGFSIGVCVNDRHTGTTAYPDIYVNTSPLQGACEIRVQVWDDSNHQLSDAGGYNCTPNHYVGTAVTRISPTVSVHTFARLNLNGATYGVDSQPIRIGAYDNPTKWRAYFDHTNSADQGDVINVVLARASTVSMAAVINALELVPGRYFAGGAVQYPYVQVYGTTTPTDKTGWPAGKCINWLQANVQSSGSSYVNQQYSAREGGCDDNALVAVGIDHFRAWQQSATSAWFVAASTEQPCVIVRWPPITHCIISYDDGRDLLVQAIRTAAAQEGWSIRVDDATPYVAGYVTNPDPTGTHANFSGHVSVITLH